jgi:hypothetical protein
MKLQTKLTCKLRDAKTSKVLKCLYYTVILVLMGGLCVSAWVLMESIDSSRYSKKDGMTVALAVTFFLLAMLLIVIAASATRDFKCIDQLSCWQILNRCEDASATDGGTTTRRLNDCEEADVQSRGGNDGVPEILILPTEALVRGRAVEAPKLTPSMSSLRSIGDSGQVFVAFR